MEKQFKKLLRELQEKEKMRKEELDQFDFQKGRFDDQMENFDNGMKQDIADGLYKNTPGDRLQQLIEDEKNRIREKYNNQNNELSNENRESIKERHVQEKESDYKQINDAIKDYHLEMLLELNNARRKLSEIETERETKMQEIDEKITEKEAEYNAKMQEIDKKIAEKEAEKTHQIILNRDSDIETNVNIKRLAEEIERLKFQKESISNEEINQIRAEKEFISGEYDAKIETQSQYVQDCAEQKERAAKFIGQISLSSKSIEEIYQELFGEEQPVEEVEEQQPIEVVEEEQPVEVVEEEQPLEIVEEEQPVEEVEEEQPIEVVEEEQPVEVVEEEQPAEEVKKEQPVVTAKENQPVKEVKEEKPAKEVKREQPTVKTREEQKMPQFEKRTISEQEKNYHYFENNKKKIVEYFMDATGIKQSEASKIFEDKKHCEAIGEMSRIAMINRNGDALTKKMLGYYWRMDSKLDIEVSSKGIRYNDEEIEPIDVTSFGDNENENAFINKIIEKYEEVISTLSNGTIVYDKNIIKAIAMDNCIVASDNKLKLTVSGSKKLNDYLKLIVDPKHEKGTVTYNLEKVTLLRSLLNVSTWSPEKVLEIRKIANQARKTYATTITGRITKYQWAIQDWFKGLKIKKITSGEQEKPVQKSENSRNSWELPEKLKAYANAISSRTTNKSVQQKQEQPEIEEK